MTLFRRFQNGDVPTLADLWNRGLAALAVARPLSVYEFEAMVMGKLGFEAEGLIIAEQDGRIVGFAHAGFGPLEPAGPSHRLDRSMGTVAMLVVAPEVDDPDLELGLVEAAEAMLRRQGAQVVYAGGQYPLNPFYWGLYGGSEFAGILEADTRFQRAVQGFGFQPVASSVLYELDLSTWPDTRDPRSILIRRRTRLEVRDDAVLDRWWDALAIGTADPVVFELWDRSGPRLAQGQTWEMAGFDRLDGRPRVGLIGVEVDAGQRRRGYGRYLVAEVLRFSREQGLTMASVQTGSTNAPARAFYESLGFVQTETAMLYRLPSTTEPGPPTKT